MEFALSFKKNFFTGGKFYFFVYKNPKIEKIFPACGSILVNNNLFIYGKHFLKSVKFIKN